MPSSPMEDLHKTVFKTLHQNGNLVTLLGGPNIFDRLPDRKKPPYIVVGDIATTDWSTATEAGEALSFTIHTWSRKADRQQSYTMVELIKTALNGDVVNLTDHNLVNLRCVFSEIARDVSNGFLHGLIRFRAVTEPLT